MCRYKYIGGVVSMKINVSDRVSYKLIWGLWLASLFVTKLRVFITSYQLDKVSQVIGYALICGSWKI